MILPRREGWPGTGAGVRPRRCRRPNHLRPGTARTFHVAAGAIAELARQPAAGEGPLALADHQAGFAGAFASLGRQQTLVDDDLGGLGILFQVAIQVIAHRRVDDAFDLAVAELGLGLPFELRLGHAQRDDGREPFAEVVARGDQVFEQALLFAVVVQAAGQGRAKAGDVRPAFDGVDVVDERVDVFGVLGGVLHGDFQADTFVFAGDVDHLGVGGFGGPIQMFDELDDATLVMERFASRRCERRRR